MSVFNVPDRVEQRRLTFPPSYRLKRRCLIRSLFDRTRDDVETVAVGCTRLLYRVVDRDALGHDVPLQVGFAPGPRAESGVERNRIRRLLREVYRVHQYTLVDPFVCCPEALIVMMLFRGAPTQADDCIGRDLPRALRRAAASLDEHCA
ncbi:ribonuclease P protein component [Salinibacter altiplanensis]|uniref:ribonuclease P protein component n=1 Tax=Salinibacter altiplanensis TaxID=1803181 RepID=UPI000C9F70C5|nr:ribonuclease P protein component [Salinibacter altiplanensis]